MPSHEPDSITGQHRSVVAMLSTEAYRKILLDKFFVSAIEQRARPPIMIGRVQDGNEGAIQPFLTPSANSVISEATKTPIVGGSLSSMVQYDLTRKRARQEMENGDDAPFNSIGQRKTPAEEYDDIDKMPVFDRKKRKLVSFHRQPFECIVRFHCLCN